MRYGDIESSPAYQLWLATNAWQRRLRRALAPFKLTHVQYLILASIDFLSQGEEFPTQVELSRFAALDINMTSQVVRALEGRGLVVRSTCVSDKRAHRLSLTPAGAEVRHAARAVVRPVTASFFEPLGDDLEVLTAAFRKLNQEAQT